MRPAKKHKIIFLAVIIGLLALPLYFIYKSESLMSDEKNIYRFRPLQLIDPSDPMRGNYMIIDFDRNVEWKGNSVPAGGAEIFVVVERDSAGFAFFDYASSSQPESGNYFTTRCRNHHRAFNSQVVIEIPFDKYFLNENNAKLAEMLYSLERSNDSTSLYIEVAIADGEALLKDIYFEGMPLNEYLNALTPQQRAEIEEAFKKNRRPFRRRLR